MLDPSVKFLPFDGNMCAVYNSQARLGIKRVTTCLFGLVSGFEGFARDTKLEHKLPTKESVLQMLEEEIRKYKSAPSLATAGEVEILHDSDSSQQSGSEPPTKKTKQSMLERLQEAQKDEAVDPEASELEMYKKFPAPSGGKTVCPLGFWKKHSSKFPTISSFAATYLTIPASSGSVERLFSVAGAIARARRSRLSTEKLEQLLCCRKFTRSKKHYGIDEEEELQLKDLEDMEGFSDVDDDDITEQDEDNGKLPSITLVE